jgi:hypothetical protein
VAWSLDTDDEKILNFGIKFFDKVREMAEAKGLMEDYLFLNDAAMDQEVIKSYGNQSVAKLRSVSKKYDPKQVFQKLVKGGFKLY